MKELLEGQLSVAGNIQEMSARREYVGRLRASDWNALRGEFPIVHRNAEQAAQRLLSAI